MRARFAFLPAALLAALALAPDSWATVPGGNLIRNPGAEAGAGSPTGNDFLPIPDWTTTPKFTAVVYGASGFPDAAVAAKIGGGKNFFAGGQDTALSTATQTIDVSGAAAEIDAGRVTASVSAYIGGFSSQDDNGVVTGAFLAASGAQLGILKLGPVTAADRGNQTTLLPRSARGAVPAGTRSIRVVLTATRTAGAYDDGYFDNLDLTLSAGSPPPPVGGKPVLTAHCGGRGLLLVLVRAVGTFRISSVTFYVGRRRVKVVTRAPFAVRIHDRSLPGRFTLKAVVRGPRTVTLRRLVHRC